jgi:hypothetical protein
MHQFDIINAINTSPMNRGLSGEVWVADDRNVSINIDDDVFLFDYENEGVYQGHFLATEGGKKTVRRAKLAANALFDLGATMIFGLVPQDRRDVAVMARWVGFTYKQTVPTPHGVCDLYVFLKDTK